MGREFCVEPMEMRMARRERGTSQPIQIVKKSIKSHSNAHMTHQMIQIHERYSSSTSEWHTWSRFVSNPIFGVRGHITCPSG